MSFETIVARSALCHAHGVASEQAIPAKGRVLDYVLYSQVMSDMTRTVHVVLQDASNEPYQAVGCAAGCIDAVRPVCSRPMDQAARKVLRNLV